MKARQKTNHNRDAKISRRKERRELKRNPSDYSPVDTPATSYAKVKEIAPLRAQTAAQAAYLSSFENNIITFGTGPAGTGKTYCAGAFAANLLKEGKIEKIIITRPAVEAGESFGFLPGEIEDKFAPFLEPFRDVLNERLGKTYTDYLIKTGKIIASPLSFMRGKTFSDAVVILDEAQNTTPTQLKMFLTRIGENCTVIVDGDIDQKDIHGLSGLQDAVKRLKNVPLIGHVEFGVDDIVRSGIVRDIITAYSR